MFTNVFGVNQGISIHKFNQINPMFNWELTSIRINKSLINNYSCHSCTTLEQYLKLRSFNKLSKLTVFRSFKISYCLIKLKLRFLRLLAWWWVGFCGFTWRGRCDSLTGYQITPLEAPSQPTEIRNKLTLLQPFIFKGWGAFYPPWCQKSKIFSVSCRYGSILSVVISSCP